MAEIISMPKLGFDMAEGTLVRWVKAEGEEIHKGDVLAEIETDKATVEVESNFNGIVNQHLVQQGSIVPVGTPIAVIAEPGEQVNKEDTTASKSLSASASEEQVPQAAPTSAVEPIPAEGGMLKASPLARKMALEKGLDLNLVQGSGPGGRIVRSDVERALTTPKPVVVQSRSGPAPVTAAPQKAGPVVLSQPLLGVSEAPADQKIPMGRLRAAIGRRMVESKQQLPHFYVTHTYNMDAVMRLRKEINALLPEEQKLSVNDFIIKAAALALRRFPNINASIEGDHILRHGQVNVGIAVSVEGGLLTVVSQDADSKSLRMISNEIKEMVGRVRQGKVKPEDIEGSTFSVSNLGMYDVEDFIAIINPPEAAILAVGSVKEVPVVVDGELRVGMRMKATISADHRVTDGAEAAQFLQVLADYLESPLRLLI